jgi:ribonuclease T2
METRMLSFEGRTRRRARLAAAFFAVLASSILAFVTDSRAIAADGQQAGKFDYYLLTLSWSPAFCSMHQGQGGAREQCGQKRYGFVVHGLWPQYKRGYPQSCETDNPDLPDKVVERVLPIMPSHPLIEHEWAKHGTCSGLAAQEYFGLVEKFYSGITVPASFEAPRRAFSISPGDLKQRLLDANPGLTEDAIVVPCKSKMLEEVRICYSKEGAAQSCAADVKKAECRRPSLIVQPLR